MSKNEDLRIAPLKNYAPLNIPTLAEAGSQPTLKTLPARWKKNAAVMACLGLGVVGAIMFSGCGEDSRQHHVGAAQAPSYVTQPTEQETLAQIQAQIEAAALEIGFHRGGEVGTPIYVVHITEQEVLGYIYARLEAAGLNLDTVSPNDIIFGSADSTNPFFRFFYDEDIYLLDSENRVALDSENQVAIVSISWAKSTRPFSAHGSALASRIEQALSRQIDDIAFGVFHNPGQTVPARNGNVRRRDKESARPNLIRDLTAQVDDFIARLQAEGIIYGNITCM